MRECHQGGYSSVGTASDCRLLQPSDGHWFDSDWPDFVVLHFGIVEEEEHRVMETVQ